MTLAYAKGAFFLNLRHASSTSRSTRGLLQPTIMGNVFFQPPSFPVARTVHFNV